MWWNEYYNTVSDDELLRYTGMSSIDDIVGCEDVPGYSELSHVAWLIAKDEYSDKLSEDGNGIVELVDDGQKQFLATVIRDRVYDVTDEVEDAITTVESDAEFDEVRNFCEYFDIDYPEDVVDNDDYFVPRWDDQRAVSYFGYDQLQDMIEEVRDEYGLECGIAGNGDLYIYK